MYNKTLGTTKKLAFAVLAASVLAIAGTGVKAFAEPVETIEEAYEEHDETVAAVAEVVVAEEAVVEEAPAAVITEEAAEAFAEAYGDAEFTNAVFEDAAAPEGYADDAVVTEEVSVEERAEETAAEEAEATDETADEAEAVADEEVAPTEVSAEAIEGEREVKAYYDFGADEYSKRMEPLVSQDEEGRTIYINYLPAEDDNIVGWHQDGFKMMAVVEPCGTKGVIYLESNNLPDKIKIDSIGFTELKNIIKFEDNSYVKSIEFGKPKSFGILMFKDHAITVNSSGVNKWFYTQSMNFQDESGDVYKLGMMRFGEHEVAYDSDAPKISVITWGY